MAGRVIASHYAEPLERVLKCSAELVILPRPDMTPIASLGAGTVFRMLDNSRGWAWGYAPDGRVGYVKSSAF